MAKDGSLYSLKEPRKLMVTIIEDFRSILNNLSKLAKDKNFKFERLYRLLYNKDLYYKAIAKLYKNEGIGTPGTDGKAIDGINEEQFDLIIESLRNESYQPKPTKRVYIPKKHSNKLRPLGLPSFTDKLIQEIIRLILDIIYEPLFSESSHGFREHYSCHTALSQIQKQYTGVSWFIEGDIKGAFDNIDHHILIKILKRRINDERFINLIWKFLKAGYLEDWQYHNTYSGCPQGGIVSPILANIYLNEMDNFIEKKLKPEFDKGRVKDRKVNPEYRKLSNKVHNLKREIDKQKNPETREKLIKEYKETRKKMLQTPYFLPNNGEVRRLQYVRYADDWLIGVIGSKDDCRKLKDRIEKFLKEELKLELSKEKTLITHSDKPAKFLSYDIQVRRDQKVKRRKDGVYQRNYNRTVVLKIPKRKLEEFIIDKNLVNNIDAKQWIPKARSHLLHLSELEILSVYNGELRGLYNYYALAENVADVMNNLHYVMEYSCLKTYARKFKTTIGKFKDKHRIKDNWGISYQTKKGLKTQVFYKGFQKKSPLDTRDLDCLPNNAKYFGSPSELERRLRATKCELCGKENVSLECHHTNKLKNLKGKLYWEKVMLGKRRKTLMICHECHNKIHNGTFDRCIDGEPDALRGARPVRRGVVGNLL